MTMKISGWQCTCSGGMGDDPLDMASSTGRSCGTVGMETGMMDFVTCPISAGGRQEASLSNNKPQNLNNDPF